MDMLLQLLKKNARLSNAELAIMLGSTEEEVGAKIAQYEKDGVIKGYTAILNDDLADKNTVSAYIELKVTPQADRGFEDIALALTQYDEITGVSLMSGAYDLAVTICGTDLKTVALFVGQRLSTINGVTSTATHFVLKRYKEKGFFIYDDAVDERGLVSP